LLVCTLGILKASNPERNFYDTRITNVNEVKFIGKKFYVNEKQNASYYSFLLHALNPQKKKRSHMRLLILIVPVQEYTVLLYNEYLAAQAH